MQRVRKWALGRDHPLTAYRWKYITDAATQHLPLAEDSWQHVTPSEDAQRKQASNEGANLDRRVAVGEPLAPGGKHGHSVAGTESARAMKQLYGSSTAALRQLYGSSTELQPSAAAMEPVPVYGAGVERPGRLTGQDD